MSATTANGTSPALTFPGVMLIVMSVFNVVNGVALIEHANWVSNNYFTSNADTWGWILIGFAVLQLLAGIKLVGSKGGGATLAVMVASIGMMVWFLFLFAVPFAALIGTAVNFSIIASVLSSDRL